VYKRQVINGFSFQAPNADVTINLITVGRAPGQPPSGITKIAPGGVRVDGSNNLIFTFGGADIPDPIPLPLAELQGDTGPAGPTGDTGPVGDTGDAATVAVGTVTTLSPGESATVVNSGDSGAAVLDFGLPAGQVGATGDTGATGATGSAATIEIGTVSTLSPGASATAVNVGSSGAAVIDLGLPAGVQGEQGLTGPAGPQGSTGPAATVTVGTITTVSPGSPASVTNVGTAGAAVFDFSIPKGDTGSASSQTWSTLGEKPDYIAAGASPADARAVIDAEYTGNKGVALGYASLDSGGKVPMAQLPSAVMAYQGAWDADTNTPTLADGSGNQGDVYRVTVAADRDLGSGTISFSVGDYVIANASLVYEKADNTDAVASVAGKTGVVTLDKSDVGLGNVDNTTDLAKPISTATQSALDGKEPTLTGTTSADYYRGDKTWATLNKAAVGLGSADNTADLDKPISSATQSALDGKEPTVNAGVAGQYYRGDKTWATLNKAAVGLSNVDNTADSAKPISSATQTALNGKEPTLTGTTSADYYRGDKTWATLNKTAVGLSNVDNTADADKPVSTAAQAALDGKEPTLAAGATGDYYRGDKTWATLNKAAVGLSDVDNTADAAKSVSYASTAGDADTVDGVEAAAFQLASEKGATGGYCGLDGSGLVDYTDLPVGSSASTVCAGDDSRLSDARTPTAAGQVADMSIVAFGANTERATGTGDFPFGVKLQRDITFTSVTFRVATADASGNLVVELRKNGSQVSGTPTTIAAANQVTGGTSTGTWAFSAGDILTVHVTAVGTTPGDGLVADIKGLTA